jgi:F420-dependent oxidoreductase-like protein
VTIRLGYQIPNFTYPDVPVEQTFDTVVAQAREAEGAGFDTVLLMDHFYQLPGIGAPENAMLECYTTLGALAAATSTVQLSALVTGNTYRNPAMLAKTVTTLDVVSHGRAVLGIGAGWFEQEHLEYGYEFGTFTERFEKLEEALQIIGPMLRGERPTFTGKHYRVQDALNNPRVRPSVPVMLGGGGEQKTFRLAALHADHLNIICGRDEVPRKLAALLQRCEENDRDPATLPTSVLAMVLLTESDAQTEALLAQVPPDRRNRVFAGTPERIAEQVHADLVEPGAGGVTLNLIRDGHRPGAISAVAAALKPLFP